MRAVVTRVNSASVTIGGRVEGAINKGFLVLLGVGPRDDETVCDKLAEKICNLRIFEDENEKMNLNLEQVRAAGGVSVHPVCRHLLPPPRLLPRRQARPGCPAV